MGSRRGQAYRALDFFRYAPLASRTTSYFWACPYYNPSVSTNYFADYNGIIARRYVMWRGRTPSPYREKCRGGWDEREGWVTEGSGRRGPKVND